MKSEDVKPNIQNGKPPIPSDRPLLPDGKVFRCIWVSTAWDLHADAIRDFTAVTMSPTQEDMPFKVVALNTASAHQVCRL